MAVRLRVARWILWMAVVAIVVAQFMPFLVGHMTYELWPELVKILKAMPSLGGSISYSNYVGIVSFTVGSFCVVAAPWCVRALHGHMPLRWIGRMTSAAATGGMSYWFLDRQFDPPHGCLGLMLAMGLTTAGLFLIPERMEEDRERFEI